MSKAYLFLSVCCSVASGLRLAANESSLGRDPILILSSGPTGSGKTGQQEKIQTEQLGEDKQMKKILVDEYVENDLKYKTAVYDFFVTKFVTESAQAKDEANKMKMYMFGFPVAGAGLGAGVGAAVGAAAKKTIPGLAIGAGVGVGGGLLAAATSPAVQGYQKRGAFTKTAKYPKPVPDHMQPSIEEINEEVSVMTKEEKDVLTNAYFGSRNKGCRDGRGCSRESDGDLYDACKQKIPVAKEVTGKFMPWNIIRNCKAKAGDGLEVWVAGNLVTYCGKDASPGLVKRNSGRAGDAIMKFFKDPEQAPGPRLPDLGELPKNTNIYVDNMKKLVQCVARSNCQNKIDKVLLYSNDEKLVEEFKITAESTQEDVDNALARLEEAKAPLNGAC